MKRKDFRKTEKRTKRNNYGTGATERHLSQLLPSVMGKIGRHYQERPDLVMAAWPEVVGSRLASMTEVTAFAEGVLHVKVKNSSLYSLLNQYDKPRIIKNLRDKFPNTLIKTVFFRLG